MLFWHVPAPNEALLISGSKSQAQETQSPIVPAPGGVCLPHRASPLTGGAVAVFKVGDDPVSIANAARRFLAEQNRMEELVGRIFAGHLRSITGGPPFGPH